MKTVQDLARTILRDIETERSINEQFLNGMKHGVLLLVERIVDDARNQPGQDAGLKAGELSPGETAAAQPEGDSVVQGQRDPDPGA